MPRILISVEQLREAASTFEEAADQEELIAQRLESTMEALSAEWTGLELRHLYQEWQQLRASARRESILMRDIARHLDAVASRFEAADRA